MNVFDHIKYEFGSMSAFAEKLGLHQNAVYKWVKNKRIPVNRMKAIESLSAGKITKEMMRPDLFSSK